MIGLYHKQTPRYLSALLSDFQLAAKKYPHSEITELASSLLHGAVILDRLKAIDLPVNFKFGDLVRNASHPPEFEHPEILKAAWADNVAHPLGENEAWNKGRRATATGQVYELDAQGRPVNPYMETGINGRGVLGAFGPNHAVDNGMIILKDDGQGNKKFSVLGILRKYDNNAPALAGGFAKYKDGETGALDLDAIAQNQMEEFFEEAISGSVELLPEFEEKIDKNLQIALAPYGDASHEMREETRTEVITALRMEQVQKYDPEFLIRLKAHIAAGHECFAGPVLNDPRNTNNAWIESRLSWSVLDDESWARIRGDDKFGYDFVGGDDASGIVFHELNPDTIRRAYASHGPMMCFLAASFALDRQEKKIALDRNVVRQLQQVAAFL